MGEQRRRYRQGEVTRQKVLEATALLASREGHRAATIAQITRQTGVPASSIYWHFGNKQKLIAAAMEHSYRQSRNGAPKWQPMPGAPDRLARLSGNITYNRNGSGRKTSYWLLGLVVAIEKNPEDSCLLSRFQEMRAESRQQILLWWNAELTFLGVPQHDLTAHSSLMADLTLAVLDGRFIRNALGPRLSPEVTDLLCRGLLWYADHLVHPSPAAESAVREIDEQREAQTSREIIVRAATVVLSEQGFHGATIARICEVAGLPASSLYWSFKDKGDLLAAVIREGREEASASLDLCLQPDVPNWRSAVTAALTEHLRWVETRPEIMLISQLLSLQRQEGSDSGRRALSLIRRESCFAVAEWLFRATSATNAIERKASEDLAEIPALLIDGLFVGRQLGNVQTPLPSFAGVVFGILHGAVLPVTGEDAEAAR